MTTSSTTSTNTALADLTKSGGALDLGPDAARLVVRMLRLLSEGKPLPKDRVDAAIADLGISAESAAATLATWTEREPDDTIVGLGITYNPTAHRMTVDGHRMWTWCAMDTLIFSLILGKRVTVQSAAPDTGDVVRLQAGPHGITGADPAGAVISWPRRDSDHVDLSSTAAIWGSFCHHSFLFPSRAAAEHWAADRDDVDILSLDEGFAAARALAAALTRYDRAGA